MRNVVARKMTVTNPCFADRSVEDLLAIMRTGNREAEEQVLALLYKQLRSIAGKLMRGERPGHTLEPTALVHEVYLLLRRQKNQSWRDRSHYIGTVVSCMRRILVDHAREKRARKRGGDHARVPIQDVLTVIGQQPEDLLALNEALEKLAAFAPFESHVVELRFIGGFTLAETAEILGVASKTVERGWARAKAWLFAELSDDAAAMETDSGIL